MSCHVDVAKGGAAWSLRESLSWVTGVVLERGQRRSVTRAIKMLRESDVHQQKLLGDVITLRSVV